MEIQINDPIESIDEISVSTFNVQAINSIADLYEPIRQKSKAPTFALTH